MGAGCSQRLLPLLFLCVLGHFAAAQSNTLLSQCVDIPAPVNKQLCAVVAQEQCFSLTINATLDSNVLLSQGFSIGDVTKNEQEIACRSIDGTNNACQSCLSLTNIVVNSTSGTLNGCLALKVKCWGNSITSQKLGCFALQNCSVPVCPNECSQHGNCTPEGCVCDANYFAADCSVNAHDGCFSTNTIPETCVYFQQQNCSQMDVEITVSGFSVVDDSVSINNLANGLQLCAGGDQLPCQPCFTIDEFTAGLGHYSACASTTLQCAGVQIASFSVGCVSGNLTADCVPDVCPGGCSGHGTCTQLKCQCDEGYQGPDCSVSANSTCLTRGDDTVCFVPQGSCTGGVQVAVQGDAEETFLFRAADIGTPQCFTAFQGCSYCLTVSQLVSGIFDVAASMSVSLSCDGFSLNFQTQSFVAMLPSTCFSPSTCTTTPKDAQIVTSYQHNLLQGTLQNFYVKTHPKVAQVNFMITSTSPNGLIAYSRASCPATPGTNLHSVVLNGEGSQLLTVSDCTTAETIQGGSFYTTVYCPLSAGCINSPYVSCGLCNVTVTALLNTVQSLSTDTTVTLAPNEERVLSTGPVKSGDTFKVMVKVLEASAEQPAPSVLVANNVCPSDSSWMYKYDFSASKTEFTFDLKGPCDDYFVLISGPEKGSIKYEYGRVTPSSTSTTVLVVIGCVLFAALVGGAVFYWRYTRKKEQSFMPLPMSEEEANVAEN